MPLAQAARTNDSRDLTGLWNKVPEITIFFWVIKVLAIAYILTRPLGASSGDLLSQSKADGGLGLGTTGTSAIFLVTIVGLVVFLTQRQKQEPEPTAT